MSDTIIKVNNLAKAYRIGLKERKYDTLGAKMVSWIKAPINNFKNIRNLKNFKKGEASADIIWALKNVSFEVKEGEVLGIIGKNGAGKTTLLKVLSKITEPTTGRAELFGRVGSLLEVGTGFNPELTGRENVYLNGTILGMSKKEVSAKFDGIVDFSGVEKFIDTPVKRYSSGMKVRLAFAVAAHLEPEILFIDEVLAVGDEEFQKKCLGKMNEVAKHGRTILFVSHNLNAVNSLCNRCIVLNNGEIDFRGTPKDSIDHYLKREKSLVLDDIIPENASSFNSGEAKFKRIRLVSDTGEMTRELFFRQKLLFIMELQVFQNIMNPIFDIKILNRENIPIVYSTNHMNDSIPQLLNEGLHQIKVEMDNCLQPNDYSITIGIHYSNGRTIDFLENVYYFSVLKISAEKTPVPKFIWSHGNIYWEANWDIIKKN